MAAPGSKLSYTSRGIWVPSWAAHSRARVGKSPTFCSSSMPRATGSVSVRVIPSGAGRFPSMISSIYCMQ